VPHPPITAIPSADPPISDIPVGWEIIMVLVFAAFLALITFWLHRRIVRATAMPRPWSIVADAVLVIMWAFAVVGIATGRELNPSAFRAPAWLGLAWLAVVLYLVLGVIVVGLMSLIWRLVLRVRPSDTGRRRRLLAVRVTTGVVVIAALVTTSYGVWEAASPRVTQTTATLPRLPEQFDGIRVALISDLHVGPARGSDFTQQVVDEVMAEKPDLIAITGDLADGTVAEVGADIEPLSQLRAPLGVFGVSGNHEFYADDGGRWLDHWEQLGVTTLRNQRVEVTHDGATIDVVGIQDYTAPQPYEPDLPRALAGSDPDRFRLLLAHEPRQALQASDLGVDLQLSGHTHGGQIWPIRYLVPLQQPSVEGLDKVGNTVLYTTRGAGAWGPPVRVGAPPEVTILELHRS
jgi:predicted MPP superfamily phosphohydrolase